MTLTIAVIVVTMVYLAVLGSNLVNIISKESAQDRLLAFMAAFVNGVLLAVLIWAYLD